MAKINRNKPGNQKDEIQKDAEVTMPAKRSGDQKKDREEDTIAISKKEENERTETANTKPDKDKIN